MPSDQRINRFTEVDWEKKQQNGYQPRGHTVFLLLSLGVIATLFAYDYIVSPDELFWLLNWDVGRVDWLFLISFTLFIRYGAIPLLTNREKSWKYVKEFLTRPSGVLSLAFILMFGFLGLIGPDPLLNQNYPRLAHRLQPPPSTAVFVQDLSYYNCIGELNNGYCHGTWQYPLGTTRYGENVVGLLVSGMRVGLKLGLSTAMIMALIGTAVGTAAGYYGGWVDEVLMRYVDFQQTIPAIIVYIVLATMFFGSFQGVTDGGLFSLALVFGLLDWGGIARLIRGEVLKRKSKPYIQAAKAAGASDLQVIREHIIPNSTATIVTALTRQIPLLILAQAALAYMSLNRVNSDSLGRLLRLGLEPEVMVWHRKWWISTAAVILLIFTIVAFNVFGDTLRDVLDSQEVY